MREEVPMSVVVYLDFQLETSNSQSTKQPGFWALMDLFSGVTCLQFRRTVRGCLLPLSVRALLAGVRGAELCI